MILFLDCEYNGFGGELLSIALASECGRCFYWIVSGTTEVPTDWVAEHVIPIMGAFDNCNATGSLNNIRRELQFYLSRFDKIHVVADWPEDIVHFCKLLLTDVPGQRINTPPLTMEIVRIDCASEMPHNALADAVGIRKEYLGRTVSAG